MRRLGDANLIARHRSAGGHRYSRTELRLAARAFEMREHGTDMAAASRIVTLEDQLDEATGTTNPTPDPTRHTVPAKSMQERLSFPRRIGSRSPVTRAWVIHRAVHVRRRPVVRRPVSGRPFGCPTGRRSPCRSLWWPC
jgi:hypothetical protein